MVNVKTLQGTLLSYSLSLARYTQYNYGYSMFMGVLGSSLEPRSLYCSPSTKLLQNFLVMP